MECSWGGRGGAGGGAAVCRRTKGQYKKNKNPLWDWEELPEIRGSEFLAVVQPETQSYGVRWWNVVHVLMNDRCVETMTVGGGAGGRRSAPTNIPQRCFLTRLLHVEASVQIWKPVVILRRRRDLDLGFGDTSSSPWLLSQTPFDIWRLLCSASCCVAL